MQIEPLSSETPTEHGGPPQPRLRAVDVVLVLALSASFLLVAAALIDVRALTVRTVLALLALQAAIPMAAVYVVVIRGRGLSWPEIGFRRAPRRWLVRAGLIALALLPAVSLVNLAAHALAGRPFRNPQLEILAPEGFTWEGLIGMLVMAGIVAPIVEEIVFRGVLYGWLRARIGIAAAAMLSAILFGAAHGIAMLVPALVVTGLVLAWVYEKSGSLWPPIFVHGVFNMAMVVALYAALAAGVPLE